MSCQFPLPRSCDGPPDGRRINYLRISVTDRCNLACRYCVPKSQRPFVPHEDVARYEEILSIAEAGRDMGITKIRITGGEPLVRKGLCPFISRLAAMEGIEDIAITTNGVRLYQHLDALVAAGVRRLNISLDTLDRRKFQHITGTDCFGSVWQGILAAHAAGIFPIKLNVVALKGINDDEIKDLAGLVRDHPFHVRFIEYMPMGNTAIDSQTQQMLIPEIQARVESALGPLTPVSSEKHDGPARRFTVPGARGEIGFISPLSAHFCHQCNRLRLTATGTLRSCLLDTHEVDVLAILRQGGTRSDIQEAISRAIAHKPLCHGLAPRSPRTIASEMSSIGG